MAVFTGKTYENDYVVLDGTTFERCSFTKCKMVYRGGELPNIISCKISNDCEWAFEDAASRTLTLLHMFHRNGASQLVDQVIAKIRLLPN